MVRGPCYLSGRTAGKSLCSINLSNCTRKDIRDYFENAYDLDETLFTSLKDESVFRLCPDRLRLPLIFYFGHTAAVFVNKLMLSGLLKERVDAKLETLLETGVDEMSWDDTENYRMGGSFEWPSIKAVFEYRSKVRKVILDIIDNTALTLPITQDSPWWTILLGVEHERIHLETSSVLIRQLPVDMVEKPANWSYAPISSRNGPVLKNPFIKVEGRVVKYGKPKNFPSFGWDNEYGEVTNEVPSFEAQQYPVTNREYLKFVEDGGYNIKKYWSDEGWKWKEFRQARHPTFWVCTDGCKSGCGASLSTYSHCSEASYSCSTIANGTTTHNSNGGNNHFSSSCKYRYRAIFDVIEMPLDWPVDANYHEAKAYCRWLGDNYRLPTEIEYRMMCGRDMNNPENFPDCDVAFSKSPNCNINLMFCSSNPVNYFAASPDGFYDVIGNVWEWAEDHFNGLPGFETHYVYHDFSTPCYDGRHNMIMYGSWATTGGCASTYARFAFRRHFFQHAGFRCVRYDCDSKVPVRLVNPTVFLPNMGIQENKVVLDSIKGSFVSSTNHEFDYDCINKTKDVIFDQFGNCNTSETDGNSSSAQNCVGLYSQLDKIWITAVKKYSIAVDDALDVGCGVGRNSFELVKLFQKVVGVDYGGRLIDIALKARELGEIVLKEKDIHIKIDDQINLENITFKQLTWLPNEIGIYDFVLLAQLNRVNNAKPWLLRLREVTRENGLVTVINYQLSVEQLHQLIGQWFTLLETHSVAYQKWSNDRFIDDETIVTVWQRNYIHH